MIEAIRIIKPDRLIHIGDIGEWESVNHHKMKRKAHRPHPVEIARGIRDDVAGVVKYVLDPIDKMCTKVGVKQKDMITGNHDQWLNYFVDDNPDYQDTHFGDEAKGYRFHQVVDWKKRGWTVHPIGRLLKIGSLSFYHGHLYGGVNHARNHLLKLGTNIAYGHFHDMTSYHIAQADGVKGAWSLGCLKDCSAEANEWLGGAPTNWMHGFGVVNWWGHRFSLQQIAIIDGQAVVGGQLVNGHKLNHVPKMRKR